MSIIPQQGPYCSGNAGKRLHPGRPPPWAPCCPVFWPIPSSDITAACPTPDPNTVPVSTTALLPAISKNFPPGTPRPSRFLPLPWTSTRRCSRSSASRDAILIPSASALPCACCFPALWMPTILIRNVSAPPTSTGSGQRSPPCRRWPPVWKTICIAKDSCTKAVWPRKNSRQVRPRPAAAVNAKRPSPWPAPSSANSANRLRPPLPACSRSQSRPEGARRSPRCLSPYGTPSGTICAASSLWCPTPASSSRTPKYSARRSAMRWCWNTTAISSIPTKAMTKVRPACNTG